MSLSSYISDVLDDLAHHCSIYDHDVRPRALYAPYRVPCRKPWRRLSSKRSETLNSIEEKSGFKVNLDVQQFRPEEISVKIVDDYVVVEGKHEEREDEHGYVSRQFVPRYLLPDNVNKEALQSKLSSDGVLTLVAPKKEEVSQSNERVIQIVQTGLPAMKHAPQQNETTTKMDM